VGQKSWTAVRQLVGYLRYDTEAELLLPNRIWQLQGLVGSHLYPQLTSKVRVGCQDHQEARHRGHPLRPHHRPH
jgi:hypothetical protein